MKNWATSSVDALPLVALPLQTVFEVDQQRGPRQFEFHWLFFCYLRGLAPRSSEFPNPFSYRFIEAPSYLAKARRVTQNNEAH